MQFDLWLGPASGRRRRRNARQQRLRGKHDSERERRELQEKTAKEIDAIVAEFHLLLPRSTAKTIGAIYARYSTRFQDSAADQVRTIMAVAIKEGIFVPREYVFFDLAVRGCKNRRQGLDALREILPKKKVSVVLFFATNRLFRKVYRTLEFVEQAVQQWGIRCIFCTSNVDTSDTDRWEMLLQMHSMMDQFGVRMYADNVRAAQSGLFEKRQVFGTITYGYRGEPIDGQFTKRRRPRCNLVVDPATAAVVERIFQWYVEQKHSIDAIVRLLNADLGIPPPSLCATGTWTRGAVRRMLTNTRYRGLWRYGECEGVWINEKDYSRKVRRPKALNEAQIEDLRIVTDELWFAAQKRLAENSHSRGRRPKDGDRHSRPKLLNGFFWCPEHNRQLIVYGEFGHYMICPVCRRWKSTDRALYSQLNRKQALRMTCERLSTLIREDENLIQDVITACQQEAAAVQRTDPAHLIHLRAQVEKLTRAIQANMRDRGDTAEDQAETDRLIRQLRQERGQLAAEVGVLETANQRPIKVPCEAQVRELLRHLGRILMAATDATEENVAEARDIIALLTGGRIELFQQGERKAQRGWLQGRFTSRLLDVLVQSAAGVMPSKERDRSEEIVIDFRDPPPSLAKVERAKGLYDQGLMNKEIAEQLQCSPGTVTKLIDYWFDWHGQVKPDSRTRAAALRNYLKS